MASAASPMLCVAEAHAVTAQELGPLRFKSIETIPAAMLGIIMGITIGLTRLAPLFSMTIICSSITGKPPMPHPMMVPMRVEFSSVTSRPESLRASRPAMMANCMNRAFLRASLGLK
jgi:hypothetical protein